MKQVFHSVSGERTLFLLDFTAIVRRWKTREIKLDNRFFFILPHAQSIDTLFPLVFPFVHLPFPFLLLARNATAIFVTARDLISAINPMELNFPAAVDRGIIKSPRIVSCFAGHKRLFLWFELLQSIPLLSAFDLSYPLSTRNSSYVYTRKSIYTYSLRIIVYRSS